MDTIKTTFLTLNDGTEICAPEQLHLMSNFVLREQGDWFEDEIHFVRKFIKPGMVALDIGANYGLYSTAIAKNLGDKGKLWCFEPTPNTANALRRTIEKNGLSQQVEIIEAGLSDHIGTATFYMSPNAELNSLTSDSELSAESLTINLLTLDQCKQEYNWNRIDFIKLDAEGEEANILKQATQTLKDCSPLVMFELRHGNQVNHSLINDFKSLGYDSYYLIPGLDILAPLDLTAPIDSYLLNLFCCKPSTAKQLEKDGYLVTISEHLPAKNNDSQSKFFAQIPALETREVFDNNYQYAINTYISSQDKSLDKQECYKSLCKAFKSAKEILDKGESKIERLSTYARIAFDIGQRHLGVQICDFVIMTYLQKQSPIQISEPYISINREFESIDTKQLENRWLLASFLDQFIRKHAFSCYFSGAKTLPYYNALKKLGFLLPDMEKREQTLLNLIKNKQS